MLNGRTLGKAITAVLVLTLALVVMQVGPGITIAEYLKESLVQFVSYLFDYNKDIIITDFQTKNGVVGFYQYILDIKNNRTCKYRVATAFVSNIKIFVDAADIIEALGGFLPESKKQRLIFSPNHPITTTQDFLRLLRTYIMSGMADQRYIADKSTFEEIEQAAWKNAVRTDMGGGPALMGKAALEQDCDILLGVKLNKSFLNSKFAVPGKVTYIGELTTINDTHIIIQYLRGKKFGPGVIAPRSNTMEINHDKDNPELPLMKEFFDAIPGYNPDIILVGGFQLMNNYKSLREKYNQKIKYIQQKMVEHGNIIYHWPIPIFNDKSLEDYVFGQLLPFTDSLSFDHHGLLKLRQHFFVKLKLKVEGLEGGQFDQNLLVR